MAVYSVQKDGRYKEGIRTSKVDKTKFVAEKDVPEVVKVALKGAPENAFVDELGDKFDPETDTDDSTDENLGVDPAAQKKAAAEKKAADKVKAEQARKQAELDAEEDDDDDEEEDAEEEYVDPYAVPVLQDDPGMGFKRVKGKTVSIFSNKPHETVKSIAGLMVPLTHEEYNTKSDSDIIKRLRELKKI